MNLFSATTRVFYKRLERIIGALFLCALAVLAGSELYDRYYGKEFSKGYIAAQFEPLTINYGVKIIYEVGDGFLSPETVTIIPAGPARHSRIKPIRHSVLLRYTSLLPKAFEKYPLEVIKVYLRAIHFAGEIDQDGFKYGGSYDPFRLIIYMVDDGGNSDDTMISTFHHEFSSLLLKGNNLLLNPWLEQNPKDFVYFQEKESDPPKTSFKGTESDYKNGFMNIYGQTNYENDFNEYSAMIFTYPDKFKKIMDRHPRVRGKFLVWLKFYQEVDPIFTEEYLFGRK